MTVSTTCKFRHAARVDNLWRKPHMSHRTALSGVLAASLFLLPAGIAGDKPAVDKDAPALELSKEEKALLELTNKEREKAELPPLKANEKLFKAARAHSTNMAKQNKLDHKLDDKD